MLLHVIRFLRAWKLCSRSLQQLSLLSDRELADAGITRADIPRIAWERSEL